MPRRRGRVKTDRALIGLAPHLLPAAPEKPPRLQRAGRPRRSSSPPAGDGLPGPREGAPPRRRTAATPRPGGRIRAAAGSRLPLAWLHAPGRGSVLATPSRPGGFGGPRPWPGSRRGRGRPRIPASPVAARAEAAAPSRRLLGGTPCRGHGTSVSRVRARPGRGAPRARRRARARRPFPMSARLADPHDASPAASPVQAPSATSAAAARTTSAPAPGRTACSLRWRRHERAPRQSRNNPSAWRAMAWTGTPAAASRSM